MVPMRLCCILLFKGSYKKYFLSLVSLGQGTAAALPPNLQLDRRPSDAPIPVSRLKWVFASTQSFNL